jgi:uncharacterized protein YifE (UPF0438 family)
VSKKIPADHQEFLRRRPYHLGCATGIFPADELKALEDFGHWLEALAAGKIKPATREQEHFLLVDREEAEPKTVLEKAWFRLKGRREYEREQNTAPPPPPAEDYGMVEFDADPCWW